MTLPQKKYGKPPLARILEEWHKATDSKTGQQGTNSIFVMNHEDIVHIPNDRTITYARVIVDFRPHKLDPHQVWITAGGNLINYPGELTTKTADLTTSKLMSNSVLSTEGAKYVPGHQKFLFNRPP
jgi:hypothetical protein